MNPASASPPCRRRSRRLHTSYTRPRRKGPRPGARSVKGNRSGLPSGRAPRRGGHPDQCRWPSPGAAGRSRERPAPGRIGRSFRVALSRRGGCGGAGRPVKLRHTGAPRSSVLELVEQGLAPGTAGTRWPRSAPARIRPADQVRCWRATHDEQREGLEHEEPGDRERDLPSPVSNHLRPPTPACFRLQPFPPVAGARSCCRGRAARAASAASRTRSRRSPRWQGAAGPRRRSRC